MTPLDSLAPERIAELLTGRFGHPYAYEVSCESTQELLGEVLEQAVASVGPSDLLMPTAVARLTAARRLRT